MSQYYQHLECTMGTEIFQHLDLFSMIGTARIVCKSFYHISYLPLSWRFLQVKIEKLKLTKESIEKYLKSLHCLEWLYCGISKNQNFDIVQQFIYQLQSYRHLRKISIAGSYTPSLTRIIDQLKYIKTL